MINLQVFVPVINLQVFVAVINLQVFVPVINLQICLPVINWQIHTIVIILQNITIVISFRIIFSPIIFLHYFFLQDNLFRQLGMYGFEYSVVCNWYLQRINRIIFFFAGDKTMSLSDHSGSSTCQDQNQQFFLMLLLLYCLRWLEK